MGQNKILIIKLGALGDMAVASAAFAAIRKHHVHDHITLMTTKPYENFAKAMGYFDEILVHKRCRWHELRRWWNLRREILSAGYTRIYDLQLVDRTSAYFYLIHGGRRPEWVGSAKGCDYYMPLKKPYPHILDRFRTLLGLVGIHKIDLPDLRHLVKNDALKFQLNAPYGLIVPGASGQAESPKRWHARGFGAVANYLLAQGIQPVIIGGPGENNQPIVDVCPQAVDLTGKTEMLDILSLAYHAVVAIGNDTGPMHMAAAVHCPIVGLYCAQNPAELGGPKSPRMASIDWPNLMDLPAENVIEVIARLLAAEGDDQSSSGG